jgi:phytoene synthase
VTTEGVAARLTRQSGTSFYYAFQVLPASKRRAIYALYSFCRVVDDCVDEAGGAGEAGLEAWQQEVGRCYAQRPTTGLGRELAAALERFPIPRRCLEDIVAGCRMDLTTRRYASFHELRAYCERVACAVGLASIEIFGYRDPGTRDYAVELGLALQLTNILRDVAPDAARDRIYVPLDDLARFSVSEAAWLAAARGGPRTPGLARLMAFEAARAHAHYGRAARRLPAGDRRSMLSAEIMGAIYRATLGELERRGLPLSGPRVRLSTPRRVGVALATAVRTLLP